MLIFWQFVRDRSWTPEYVRLQHIWVTTAASGAKVRVRAVGVDRQWACGGWADRPARRVVPAPRPVVRRRRRCRAAKGRASAGAGASAETGAGSTPSATALPDGRSAANLSELDAAKGTGLKGGAKGTVTFDPIEFLTGNAAKAEWIKEHPGSTAGPQDRYLIVNDDKQLQTVAGAPTVVCVVLKTPGGTQTEQVGFAALPSRLKQRDVRSGSYLVSLPFWLTVQRGMVTRIEEQLVS